MKKHRWITISLVLWALIWAAFIGMRALSRETNKELATLPMPQKPELQEVEPKNSASKVELYRDEIQHKKKTEFLAPEEERAERVQMAWSEVYKEGEKGAEKPQEEQGELIPQSKAVQTAPIIAEKENKAMETMDSRDTLAQKSETPTQTGFHTQVITTSQAPTAPIAVKASIFGEQEVSSGEAVKLKTAEEMTLDGETLPAGSMLIGTCALGNRLFIEIKQISIGGKLRTVKLSCLDASDMQKGLIIQKPGMEDNLQNELANAAIDEALSELPVGGGIIQSGKNIIKEVISGRSKGRIIIPHGYQLIISP